MNWLRGLEKVGVVMSPSYRGGRYFWVPPEEGSLSSECPLALGGGFGC